MRDASMPKAAPGFSWAPPWRRLHLAAAWWLVELAFPAVFFLLYLLVIKAIARIANDRHGYEGDIGRSIVWGAL